MAMTIENIGYTATRSPVANKSKNRNDKEILTAVLFDPCASMIQTVEEEFEQAIEWLDGQICDQINSKTRSSAYRIHCFDPRDIKPGTKIILFDFGGMLGARDLAESNCRELIKFAELNPSVLVIVTSSYTWHNLFKYEMTDLGFDELPNVHAQYALEYKLPEWFVNMERSK